MIRLQKLRIEEFRGIRQIELPLNGENFGICGPNGTGKSGIVDAIEFALTGDITRLAGYGTSGVTIKSHAPHVDSRKTPEKSHVELTASIASSGELIVVDRVVSAPGDPTITSAAKNAAVVIAELATHPEFALSRREIIKYILTPPGQRSKDVQALLRLEQIEKVRQSLQRVANNSKNQAKQANEARDHARFELQQALGIAKLDPKNILAVVNERRATLQLPALPELTKDTSFLEGLAANAAKSGQQQKILKKVSLADVAGILGESESGEPDELAKLRQGAIAALQKLQESPEGLRDLKRQILITQGLDLLDGELCPLCDTPWDEAELRDHLKEKLEKAKQAEGQLDALKASVAPFVRALKEREERNARIILYCNALEPKVEHTAFGEVAARLTAHRAAIERIASEPKDLDVEIVLLSEDWWTLPKNAADLLGTALHARLEALPEPSKEEEARAFLTVAQDRYERAKARRQAAELAGAQEKTAERVYEHYSASSTAILEGIYIGVEKDFSEYYQFINHEDEKEFEGKLKPSVGKLAFDVDFYGRGLFPPGAYHSEGHQDGMGLCLYLALMKHTLGDKFTFAVLDDVLMSIDAGHRRDVCRLLKTKFPKTQFIVTTHDPIWLQFMRTEQFVQSSISFGGWTVDSGPNVWSDSDVWTQIAEDLKKNDVSRAASTLRRYLEFVSTSMADKLGAKVKFHGNGQYDLGDLMPPLISAWKDLLGAARKAAESWGKKEEIEQLTAKEKDVKEKIARTQIEQWAINKAIHYNEWANLQAAELKSVVIGFKDMLDTMKCPDCGTFVYVLPAKGKSDVVRCDCGTININLKAK